MFCLLVLLSVSGQILGQIVNNVVLPVSQPYEILSPNYPDLMGYTTLVEWNLQVDADSKIKLICYDIRMVHMSPWTPDCPDVYFSIDNGNGEKKQCGGAIREFTHLSDGPKLKVKVVSSNQGSALVKCVALNTADPNPEEIIRLHPNGKARRIKIEAFQDTVPNLDRLWEFESPVGTRMSFQCNLYLSTMEPICGWTALTFNDGESTKEFCDRNDHLWFSKANKAKLRLKLDNYGRGNINCLVQAVTGPNPDEYENAVSEEVDSSEHGVTPGTRSTSCKCGWSNKSGARIINGTEARVNEFPWMVHLYVNHETKEGSWGTTCGASIITSRHVLTAAHCVELNSIVAKPEHVKMELAKHDSRKPTGKEVTIGAERIFVRDVYLQKGLYNDDISIIYTKETIDFSTPLIGPICIEREDFPIINRRILLMGWGRTEDEPSSKYLRKGKSRVMDPLLCEAADWEICTTSKPSSFCSGDSGGPLVWLDADTNRYAQVSLVSRGSSCTAKFMISTRVAHFYDWIQEVIKATEPSLHTCHKL